MEDTARRLLVALGALVLGGAVGSAFDVAGVTPENDGDITTRGLVAGLGLAAVLLGLRRRD